MQPASNATVHWQRKLLVVLLVALPLVALKVWSFSSLSDTSGLGYQQIEAFMGANGIAIQRVNQTSSGVQVHGRRDACDIQIKEVAPQGWDVSSMSVFADGKPLVFVYEGGVYAEQPVWSTWFRYRAWRLLRLVGIDTQRRTVFGVAASPECESLNLDLARLT